MTTADAPTLSYSPAPGRWVLAITVPGSGIAALDATAVSIARPAIGRDFRTGTSARQWVISGYTLSLAAFLLIGGPLSARPGTLAARIGPRPQRSAGPVVAGAGLGLLTRSTYRSSYVAGVLPAVAGFGRRPAITTAPLTAAAMSPAPAQRPGIASAVNNDVARFGGLPAVAAPPARAGITGPVDLHPDALAARFTTAALISGALCAAGGRPAAPTITSPPRVPRPAGVPAPGGYHHCGLEAPPLTTNARAS